MGSSIPSRCLSAGILVLALAPLAAGQSLDGGGAVQYGRDVRPILADRCFACHGPDAASREADLRLDRREDALAVRDGVAAIVAGDITASLLVERINDHADPMPPLDAHDPLEQREVELLTRWIAEGASYDVHWAYQSPRERALPRTERSDWARTSVDDFLLARLEQANLAPVERADPRTLVRRLSFDLLGLPPTEDQVAAFAADPSDAAWDALVEELLASPHHAERLATFWFDLVRFADTTGIHADNVWNISPYRDWVLDAFQSNMPFDQFTVEQLAGDLLPEPTLSQEVAAAYNRLNLITREGGSQPKEFLARYTADRVRNVSEVWLATTMACAECHDHKFDPLATREFYELGAFFADIEQVGVYSESNDNDFAPELDVPKPEQTAELAQLDAELAEIEARFEAGSTLSDEDRRAWEAILRAEAWTAPVDLKLESAAVLSVQPDGSVLATGGEAERDTYRLSFSVDAGEPRALRLELLPDDSLPQQGPGRARNGNVVLSEVEVFLDGEPVRIASSRASLEQPGYPVRNAHDGQRGATGWAVMRGSAGTPAEAVFELAQPQSLPATVGGGRLMEIALHQEYGSLHTLGRWRVSWSSSTGQRALEPALRAALGRDFAARSDAEHELIGTAYLAEAPALAADRARHGELTAKRAALLAGIPRVLRTVSVEPMVTRVLSRGNWMDESGPIVSPAVPAALGSLPPLERRATRLDLANWIVDEGNPLAARVLVNRLWRMFLGRGLVETLDDFGVQGAQPTHPGLLDHLALELVESGWDVRHVIRLIVRSAAYAQVSGVSTEQDPGNTWFGRQERFRLDAEFVRDNALAISGLLVRDVGGPSVRPYQPAGYWSHLNFPKRTYQPSSGDDLYRRTIYSHWQRQYLHPSLLAFDAPSRERCTAERSRSNTPQAALVLLNDPIFVEAARALAQQLLQSSVTADEARAAWLWQRALQRSPRPSEVALVVELVEDHRAHYAQAPEAALQLLDVGAASRDAELSPVEHAAWTSAARVVFNLHETIVRD